MRIRDIVKLSTKLIAPQNDVEYILYSLPSFDDDRVPEVVFGKDIQSNKFIVPDKCILFNKLNVRFKRVWRIDDDIDNKLCSTEFLPLMVNEEVCDYQYCYYLLISDKITDYLCGQNTNTSSSHKRIDPDNFLDIEVSLPSLAEQRKIGAVLSALDNKIVVNRAINKNLRASRVQSKLVLNCRGAAVNADISRNLPTLDRSLKEGATRLVA